MDKVLAIGDNVLSIGGMWLKPIVRDLYGDVYIWWDSGHCRIYPTSETGIYLDASQAPYTTKPIYNLTFNNTETDRDYDTIKKVIVVVKDPSLLSGGTPIRQFSPFINLSALEDVYLDVNLENVQAINDLFFGCSSLKEVSISKLNLTSIANISQMFRNCNSLENIYIDSSQRFYGDGIKGLFSDCWKLPSNVVQNFIDTILVDTSNVTNFSIMFNGCESLTTLNLSNLDFSNGVNFDGFFHNCKNLTTITLPTSTKLRGESFVQAFSGLRGMSEENLNGFLNGHIDFSIAKNLSYAFEFISSTSSAFVKNLDLSCIDSNNLLNASGMLSNNPYLNTLDISNIDLTHLQAEATDMFYNTFISTIYVDNCNSATITKLIQYLKNSHSSKPTYTLTTYQGRKALVRQ